MCGVGWTAPPQPHTVDQIVSIDEAAPAGLRFPTGAELRDIRASGMALTEVDADDWLDDLAQHLASHR